METNEISLHQVKVFEQLRKIGTWTTIKDVADATGVKYRTVHAHIHRMVKLGILDLAEVFPRHRYRLSEKADKRNISYLQRLEKACDIFSDQK